MCTTRPQLKFNKLITGLELCVCVCASWKIFHQVKEGRVWRAVSEQNVSQVYHQILILVCVRWWRVGWVLGIVLGVCLFVCFREAACDVELKRCVCVLCGGVKGCWGIMKERRYKTGTVEDTKTTLLAYIRARTLTVTFLLFSFNHLHENVTENLGGWRVICWICAWVWASRDGWFLFDITASLRVSPSINCKG